MLTIDPVYIAVVLVGLSVLIVLWKGKQVTSSAPLPPGPKPWPVVGNLFDIPSEDTAAAFWKLSKKYGTHPFLPIPLVDAR